MDGSKNTYQRQRSGATTGFEALKETIASIIEERINNHDADDIMEDDLKDIYPNEK